MQIWVGPYRATSEYVPALPVPHRPGRQRERGRRGDRDRPGGHERLLIVGAGIVVADDRAAPTDAQDSPVTAEMPPVLRSRWSGTRRTQGAAHAKAIAIAEHRRHIPGS